VRGLDYYNLSVFEFVTDRLGSQGTVCAGGRYDDLIAQIGGKPAPAVGWAIGVERVLDLMKEQGTQIPVPVPDVYAVVPDAAAMPVVLRTLQQLREAGVRVQMHAATVDGLGSFKSQFKRADNSGATYALIFGADELARGEVTLKSLRDGSGAQTLRPLAEVTTWAATLQSPAPNI
jgi:histidyl-tRNA synthetase